MDAKQGGLLWGTPWGCVTVVRRSVEQRCGTVAKGRKALCDGKKCPDAGSFLEDRCVFALRLPQGSKKNRPPPCLTSFANSEQPNLRTYQSRITPAAWQGIGG